MTSAARTSLGCLDLGGTAAHALTLTFEGLKPSETTSAQDRLIRAHAGNAHMRPPLGPVCWKRPIGDPFYAKIEAKSWRQWQLESNGFYDTRVLWQNL